MRRNRNKLVTVRGTYLDVNRSKCTIYSNFKMMHELIYDQLIEAKIAIERSKAKIHDE